MTLVPYVYLVLRYVHDRGAGESLNVGVLMFSADGEFLEVKLESRYERLSHAFAGFNGDHYRRAISRLRQSLSETQKILPLFEDRNRTVTDVLAKLWNDHDASFAWSTPLGGVSSDLAEELLILFDRMVTSQYPHAEEVARRDDDFIWRRVYQHRLTADVLGQLTTKKFVTAHVEIEFAHALKNGAWHVVQPVSLDYRSAESMQRRATQWVGTSVGLQRAPDLKRIYFLLGRPSDPKHRKAYERAKALLDQAPVAHELIEEEDAAQLAVELASIIEHHD